LRLNLPWFASTGQEIRFHLIISPTHIVYNSNLPSITTKTKKHKKRENSTQLQKLASLNTHLSHWSASHLTHPNPFTSRTWPSCLPNIIWTLTISQPQAILLKNHLPLTLRPKQMIGYYILMKSTRVWERLGKYQWLLEFMIRTEQIKKTTFFFCKLGGI